MDYENTARLFKILSHPIRLAILELLRLDEQCVCHMEAAFGLRQALISQHLMVLREADLVQVRREGWNIYYRVTRPEIYTVVDAMVAFSGAEPGTKPSSLELSLAQPGCVCPRCKPAGQKQPAVETERLSPTR